MGINPKQFRELIIVNVLKELEPAIKYSDAAANLLLYTAIQESGCGTYLAQLGGGPALGPFQMEKATHDDIWDNCLKYNHALQTMVETYLPTFGEPHEDLPGNLYYAAAMARIHYWRVSEALPAADDVIGMGKYWKKYYNTPLGKGTVQEFVLNVQRAGVFS